MHLGNSRRIFLDKDKKNCKKKLHLPGPVAIFFKSISYILMGSVLGLVILYIFLLSLALIWQKSFSVQLYTLRSHWYYGHLLNAKWMEKKNQHR